MSSRENIVDRNLIIPKFLDIYSWVLSNVSDENLGLLNKLSLNNILTLHPHIGKEKEFTYILNNLSEMVNDVDDCANDKVVMFYPDLNKYCIYESREHYFCSVRELRSEEVVKTSSPRRIKISGAFIKDERLLFELVRDFEILNMFLKLLMCLMVNLLIINY